MKTNPLTIAAECNLPKNMGAFIWHFLRHYKFVVLAFVVLALLAGCWGPFNSLLIKKIINVLVENKFEEKSVLIWPSALLVLNFIVFDNFTWRTLDYLIYRYLPIIKNNIISEMFKYVLGASYQYFHDNLSGRISSQIKLLSEEVTRILHPTSANFIRGFSLLIVSFISMYSVNPIFFYTLLLWFIIFFIFSLSMSKHLVKLSDQYAESDSIIDGELVDSIANVNNIRMFSRANYEISRLDISLQRTKSAFQKNELFGIKMNWAQGMLIAAMMGIMVYFLIYLYLKHSVTIGDFALILGLSMEVGHMSWFTMFQVDEFNKAVGKSKQAIGFLIVPHDIKDAENASPLQVKLGEIIFANVEFNYKGAHALFQNKSVIIKAGQKVGLVGYSGGGKSTFVNLILRLFDVNHGRILIDNQDIRNVTLDSLHQQIALIPQDPTLFHRTLMENIRYGNINASDDDVKNAAINAHAHEFIEKLPLGYNTLVGERGVKLSGGQRQRIAIARAFLKNAPILILDEATSQLDSITEKLIQESLWNLMQNKTTLVIAHRLSTLLHMDRILVFDQGKIVEEGSHSELLAQKGLYQKLWNTQVGGFLQDKNITEISS